ncbi:universal stress protein [Acuticoccus sp. MNP-M23]|uniref:universal stress protein n=1 Tax=Acuticoccus sp. MNP-M23 TaxID=3072793 RepID=UPI002815156F|nr:universal stress protein [Acuticoccus sp. MNP-M23]WMS42635.1 universal stress protein [Acuticoccus sp. MNP-M23]
MGDEMAFKTVLVHAENTEPGWSLVEAAAAFAAERDAHLVALLVGLEPSVPYASMIDVPAANYGLDLEDARNELKAGADEIRGKLERLGGSFEVRATLRPGGLAGAEFARHARYADISIFPQRNTEGNWHQLLDTTLFESGKPMLICPPGCTLTGIGQRVAIAWDAGAEAARAVANAIPLMLAADDVHVVTVDPHVSTARHGEVPGADLATMLARHGIAVSVNAIPGEDRGFASAFLTHAADMNADLVVSGAYGHSRIGQMLLGGATRDLMETADRPLLMSH